MRCWLGRDNRRRGGRNVKCAPLCRVHGEQLCQRRHVGWRLWKRRRVLLLLVLVLGGAWLDHEWVDTKGGEEGIEVKLERWHVGIRLVIHLHGRGRSSVLMAVMSGGIERRRGPGVVVESV